jgi:Flp pilus assembly protein TadD
MRSSRVKPLVTVLALAVIAASAAGCKTTRTTDTTGSIALPAGPRSEADWRRDIALYGERYRANNRDAEAAIRYAAALRGIGQRTQAAAVLEQASILHPDDRVLLGAYGRALADVGNYPQALDVLNRAHSPDQPDWRILSVQGAVLDQMGRPEEARRYYESALRIVPEEPSVLSNLGMSYSLSKELPKAEETLRRAAGVPGADRRVRQNLALVVGLQGRFDEALKVAGSDLTPQEAADNVAYLRRMLVQQNNWKKLARPGNDTAPPKPAPKAAEKLKPTRSARVEATEE